MMNRLTPIRAHTAIPRLDRRSGLRMEPQEGGSGVPGANGELALARLPSHSQQQPHHQVTPEEGAELVDEIRRATHE